MQQMTCLYFYFLQTLFLAITAYSVIYEKDFQNGNACLGPDDKWTRIDGTDFTQCITSCSYKDNLSVPISLLSSQYSEKGFQITIPSSLITNPYTIIGIDILYMQPSGQFQFQVSINDMDVKLITQNKPTTQEPSNTINCYNDFPQLTLTTIHSGIAPINNQIIVKIQKEANQFNINIKKIKVWSNCIYNCLICSKSDSCGTCLNGFEEKILPSGNKVCEQTDGCTISNCFSCAKDATTEICMRCYPGYALDASATICTLIGTQICDSNSYSDQNGVCVSYSSVCRKQDENRGDTFSDCVNQVVANNYKCPSGQKIVLYSYENYSVYNCQCDITNCAICSSLDNSCQTCNTGYAYDSIQAKCTLVTCTPPQEFNSTYNQCTDKCSQGQYLNPNTLTCANCTDTNCNTCTSANACTQCNTAYYYDTTDSICYATCLSNQYLDKSLNTCLNCGSKCSQCNKNQCTTCETNSIINPSNQNECLQQCSVSNCLSCIANTPDQCESCESNYHVQDGGCQMDCQTQNCAECYPNDSKTCLTCGSNYELQQDGSCIQICNANNCLQCWQNSTTVCRICGDKYVAVNGVCILKCNVEKCLQCASNNIHICTICYLGYYLASDNATCNLQCQLNNCDICLDTTPNACKQCKQGYALDSKQNCNLNEIAQANDNNNNNSFSVEQSVIDIGYSCKLSFSSEVKLNTQHHTLQEIFHVEILNANGYTYNITQQMQDQHTLLLLLNANQNNYKDRTLQITITNAQFAIDNKLKQTSLTQDLLPYAYVTPEQKQVSLKAGAVSSTATTVIVASIVPIAIFGNFYILTNTIDITGFFYYNLFLNIRHPENVVQFYGYFKNFQFPFIPNMFQSIIDSNYSQGIQFERFKEQGYDLYFLISTGQSVTIFILVVSLYALAKIGCLVKVNFIQKYCQRVIKDTWEFSGLIELVWNIYIYQLVGVLLQFYKYEASDKAYLLNYTLHTLISVPVLLFPFFLLYKVQSKQNIKSDKSFQIQYQFLVSGLRLYDNDAVNIQILPEIMSNNLNMLNEPQIKKQKSNQMCADNVSRLMDRKDEEKNYSVVMQIPNLIDMEKGRVSPQSSEEIVKVNNPTMRERHKQQYSKYANSILFIRKWIFGFLMIYLYFHVEAQLILISFLHIGMIIYLVYIQPIENKHENIKNLAGEFVLLAINICDYCLIQDHEGDSESKRLNIGWIIVALSGFILLWHTAQMILELSKSLLFSIKKLIIYLNSQSKVKPASLNQTNIQKDELFSDYAMKGFKLSADMLADPDFHGFQSNVLVINETNRKFSNEIKSKNNSIIFNQNDLKSNPDLNAFQSNGFIVNYTNRMFNHEINNSIGNSSKKDKKSKRMQRNYFSNNCSIIQQPSNIE